MVNIDSTIGAEAPKVLPHRETMQLKIGEPLGLPPENTGINSTNPLQPRPLGLHQPAPEEAIC